MNMVRIQYVLIAIGLLALIFAGQARAGDFALSVETGMSFFGDSGVGSVDRLDRPEIATTNMKGLSFVYRDDAWGGRWFTEVGLEHMDADGDWGVYQTNGDLARQTVQIASTSFKAGLGYEFRQTGKVFPFVKAGLTFNLNRPENSTIIELASGGKDGCVSDNSDTTSIGYYGGAGVGYDISERVTAHLSYQYTNRGRAKTRCDDNGHAEYEGYTVGLKDHSARIGITIALF